MQNKYIKRIIPAAALAMICAAAFIYTGISGKTKSAEKTIFAMDTYMEITAYGKNSEKAIEAATEEIKRLDALLSTGSDTSEVTAINENGGGTLSEDTAYLLEKSLEIYNATDGAFDITVYPLMREWGFSSGNFKVPDEKTLETLLEKVDASRLEFNKEDNTLTMPKGVEIDFGGIAKGYTSGQVAQIMKQYGIKSAKINLGGNVQTIGTKTDGTNWRIAIRTPLDTLEADYLGIVEVSDKAVVTSGGYERYFEENGKTYHHILDTKTGYPADKGLISATIISPDGTLCDALSTAVYCMGLDDAIDFWKNRSDDFDMVLYDIDKGLYITNGIEDSFTSGLDFNVIYDKE